MSRSIDGLRYQGGNLKTLTRFTFWAMSKNPWEVKKSFRNSVDTGDLLFTHGKRLTFCQTPSLGVVKRHQDQVLKVVFSRKCCV